MGTTSSLPGCNPKKTTVESRNRRMSVAERQRAIERLERSRTRQRRSEENSAAEGFAGETHQQHTPERSDKNLPEDHLAMLTALRDQGILTDEQFEIAKLKAEKKGGEMKSRSISSVSNGADTRAETCTADITASIDSNAERSEFEDIFGDLLSNLDAEMDADFGEKNEEVNGTELKRGEPSVDFTGELSEIKDTIEEPNETKDTIAESNETKEPKTTIKEPKPPSNLLEESSVDVVDSTEEGKSVSVHPEESKKEIPDEFLGNWTLVEKDHTHNLDEFLKANDINWVLRKLVISMMGNTFQFGIHRIDGGMGYVQNAPSTDPIDLMWTYQFDEETINIENKKKQYTCTLDMTADGKVLFTECPENPKYQKNCTLSINDQGIMIVQRETNGVVLERRMMRMADV